MEKRGGGSWYGDPGLVVSLTTIAILDEVWLRNVDKELFVLAMMLALLLCALDNALRRDIEVFAS